MSILRSSLILACLLAPGLVFGSATFPNAWQITDSSNAAGSTATYSSNLLSVQSTAAANLGFRLSINARLLDDFGGTESLGFLYSAGSNRFQVLLAFDAGSNLLAVIPTAGGSSNTLTLTTNAHAARAYHTHEMVYGPGTKLATYSFDGTAMLTWSGDGTTGTVGQVSWGATSEAGQGQMNFRSVQFRITNTNALIYDAGSAVTNRPVAPDPLSRGWTFSGPGTGTDTNAVSPDNIWQPAIVLNGANPLVTPWTLPFTDPGASVAALPISVDAGRFHSLALKADGTVAAWGDNTAGQLDAPSDPTNAIALAAGDSHTVVLRSDRTVIAWGDNSLGQTNVPASATNVVSVAAGLNHNLALRSDGMTVQWGNDSAITNAPVSVTNVVAIAAGQLHNIALRSNGTVVTWGFAVGQTNIPVSATSIIAVAAGTHNFALRSNGTVVVWGDNSFNQTNVPSTANGIVAIAAGLSHCLALRTNGTIIAWGAGTNNTGVSPRFGQAIVPAGLSNVVAIAAGDYHSLALRADGTVFAWGAGTNVGASPHFGQSVVPGGLSAINLATTTDSSVNTNVPGNYTVAYTTTNSFGAVAVATRTVVVQFVYPTLVTLPATMSNEIAVLKGTVNPNGFSSVAWFEWGLGSRFDQKTPPAAVGGGSTPLNLLSVLPVNLTPGLPYRCRLVASNNVGLVARGFEVAFASPIVALNGADPMTNVWGLPFVDPGVVATGSVMAVAGGRVHSVALPANGSVVAWGENFYGQTNVAATANNVIAIAAGQNHGIALRSNGTIVAWGENNLGQTSVSASATNVVAIAAGESFNLGLRRNGTLAGWGDDFYGQATAPTFVTNIAAIAAGQRHTLALFTSGNVAAWGYNAFGQTNVPPAATNIVAVAAGSGHSLVLRNDGTVFVWGINSYFQTNLPPTVTNVIAIAAGFYHSLALRADGTVVAWGAGTNNTGATPYFGQSIVPASATNVVAIAAGYYHSFAMRADGSIIAWGAGTANTGAFPNLGQAIIPGNLNSFNLSASVAGAVDTTSEGSYLLTYTGYNPWGGIGIPVTRNVIVTAPPLSPVLTTLTVLGNGTFQFDFTNDTPTSFSVLASTNVALPLSNWTVLGVATQISPGLYQFTDSQSTNFPLRFYQVRAP